MIQDKYEVWLIHEFDSIKLWAGEDWYIAVQSFMQHCQDLENEKCPYDDAAIVLRYNQS